MKRMRWIAGILTVLTFAALATRGAVEARPQPERKAVKIVEQPLLKIEIRGLDPFFEKIDGVAQAIGLPMPQPSAMLEMQMKMALKLPSLEGIDRKAPIRIFFYDMNKIAMVLPYEEKGEAYVAALKQTMELKGKQDGLLRFDTKQPIPTLPQNLYMMPLGGRIVQGTDEKLIKDLIDQVKAETLDLTQLCPLKGTVVAEIDLSSIMDKYGAMMGPGAALFSSFLKQMDQFAIALDADNQALTMSQRVVAAPNSILAKVFASMQPPTAKIEGLIPTNAFFAYIGHGGDMSLWLEPYMEAVSSMMPGYPADMKTLFDKLVKPEDLKNLYPGDFMLAILPASGEHLMPLIEVLPVTSTEMITKLFDDMMKEVKAMSEKQDLPFSMVEQAARQYNDTAIRRFLYETKPQAGMVVPPSMEQLLKMTFEMAFIDNLMVVTMGPNDLMDKTLDLLKSDAPGQLKDIPSFKKLFPHLKTKTIGVFYYNLMDQMRASMKVLPGTAHMAGKIPDTPGTVAGFMVKQDKALISVFRISIKEMATMYQDFIKLKGMDAGGAPGGALR